MLLLTTERVSVVDRRFHARAAATENARSPVRRSFLGWKRSPLLQARSEDSLLRASSNGNLFQPRTERRIGNHAFSVAEHRAWK